MGKKPLGKFRFLYTRERGESVKLVSCFLWSYSNTTWVEFQIQKKVSQWLAYLLEIVLMIIQKKKKTLKSCCRLSTRWTKLAEMHKYSWAKVHICHYSLICWEIVLEQICFVGINKCTFKLRDVKIPNDSILVSAELNRLAVAQLEQLHWTTKCSNVLKYLYTVQQLQK